MLNEYGVGFRVMHGFTSATSVYDVAQGGAKELRVLYVGDYDPSGMYMSEEDLPARLARYGGDHVSLLRIALLRGDIPNLMTFPASDKASDTRFRWFVENFGRSCAELDALDPNELRDRVMEEVESLIEPEAWSRCKTVEAAERESLETYISKWGRKVEADA